MYYSVVVFYCRNKVSSVLHQHTDSKCLFICLPAWRWRYFIVTWTDDEMLSTFFFNNFFFNCLLTCQRCWSNYSFACLERSCSSFFLLLLECITAVLWKLFDGPGESSRSSCRAGFSFYTTLYSAVTVYALMYQCMNKGNLRSLSPKSSSLIFDELKLHSLLNCQWTFKKDDRRFSKCPIF